MKNKNLVAEVSCFKFVYFFTFLFISSPHVLSVCNRRYKTASSLKAHRTQYHGGQPSSRGGTPAAPPLPVTTSPARVPVVLPPPPNLKGKEDAKRNPYCDFCLGEDHMNNKTKQPEKMVSCANCGRSGERGPSLHVAALKYIIHTSASDM